MTILKYTQAASALLDGILAAQMVGRLLQQLQQEFEATEECYAVLVTGSPTLCKILINSVC